jgi:murein DD-endopeptidase MepM/ murein hydrolase activator NlpD
MRASFLVLVLVSIVAGNSEARSTRPAHPLTSVASPAPTFLQSLSGDLPPEVVPLRPEPLAVASAMSEACAAIDAAVEHLAGFQKPEVSFASLHEALPYPIANTDVAAKFGPRKRRPERTEDRHTGMSFDATAESEIRAVADGFVGFSGPIRGLGRVVILQHGDGFMTVYALLRAARVDAGTSIRAGEALGFGTVQVRENTRELYFEIRKDGIPIDPEPWFGDEERK